MSLPARYFDFGRWVPPTDRHERVWEAFLWESDYGTNKYDGYLIEDDGRFAFGEIWRREYPWTVWDPWLDTVDRYEEEEDIDEGWRRWWRNLPRDLATTVDLTLKGYLP